jgi:hypothetical protein
MRQNVFDCLNKEIQTHSCVLLLCTTLVYYTCVLHLCITLVYYTCVLYLCNTLVYYTCVIHLCTTLVYYTCVLHLCTTLVYYTCVLHSQLSRRHPLTWSFISLEATHNVTIHFILISIHKVNPGGRAV